MASDLHMCAVCHELLSPLFIDDVFVEWRHREGDLASHSPDPMPAVDPVLVCDFCSSHRVTTSFECRLGGDWLACSTCAMLVRSGDPHRLATRASTVLQNKLRSSLRQYGDDVAYRAVYATQEPFWAGLVDPAGRPYPPPTDRR